jgi:hypothetical protein
VKSAVRVSLVEQLRQGHGLGADEEAEEERSE